MGQIGQWGELPQCPGAGVSGPGKGLFGIFFEDADEISTEDLAILIVDSFEQLYHRLRRYVAIGDQPVRSMNEPYRNFGVR